MNRRTAFTFFGSVGTCLAAAGGLVWAAPKPTPALNPSEFRSIKLVDIAQQSPDTRRFRFAFSDPEMVSGLKTASAIVLKYTDSDGNAVIRPYTPISPNDQQGTIDFIVKRYPNSKMGTHLLSMKKGDVIDIKGPFQKIEYVPNKWKHIGLIAGGTGIAPMYQIIQEINRNPADSTKVSMIYSNHTEEDVLLAEELKSLAANPNFHIYHTISKPKKGWMGGVGRVNEDMLRNIMPAPGSKDIVICVSGPPGMMETVSGDKDFSTSPPSQGELSGLLKKMGYSPKEVFKF